MLVFILLGMFISCIVMRSSSSIIINLLCWIWFLFLMPNISTYLSQSIAKTPLYDNVQSAMNEYDKENGKKIGDIWQRIENEMGLDGIGHWNFNGGEDGFRETTGGTRTTPLFYLRFLPETAPLGIDNAD